MSIAIANEFEIGQVVNIQAVECVHWDQQGQIIHIVPEDEFPLKIWFGKECDYRACRSGRSEDEFSLEPPPEEKWKECARVYEYKPEQVQVSQIGWSVKTLIDRYMRGMYYTRYELKKPYPKNGPCHIEGCQKKATQMIIINCWGTVRPSHCCPDCAKKHHLTCVDEFPKFKKDV